MYFRELVKSYPQIGPVKGGGCWWTSSDASSALSSWTDCRRNWRKQVQFRRDAPARSDQICHKPFIHIKITFIFSEVANGMTFIKHPPYLGTQPEGVRQCLKDDVAISRPVSMPTQGGQTKCMRGVVGEIKSAFQRV
jgi:hypothetical protein